MPSLGKSYGELHHVAYSLRTYKAAQNVINAVNDYAGEEIQKCIPAGVKNRIHEKGKKNKPLTKKQERDNKAKSHIRVRVEHVFGMMTNMMKGITVRSMGMARTDFNTGLMRLVCNLSRYAYLRRTGVSPHRGQCT